MNIQVRSLPVVSSVLLAWAALAVLFLILSKFLYKPVSEFLRQRKERIQSDLDGAKVLKDEAANLKNEYESRISLAKKESQEIVEAARKRAGELKEDILSDARKEAEEIVSRAKKEIIREREAALQDIKSQAGEMAILIASKIMEENIKLENQNALIDKFIDEVGSSKWQS